jgi:3-oxoacyl-[acyl-carrier-protein] synthase-3
VNGRVKTRIAGTGSFAPPRVLTNQELSRLVDTSDEWIVERTGIRQRCIADPATNPSDLGAEAARRALAAAGVAPADVDLIVTATSLPDRLLPTTACYIQAKVGCTNAGAVDVLAACTGFLYAFSIGWRHVSSGDYKNVLVIGAETLSRLTNFEDRATCVIFGDAAGAALLQPSDGPSDVLYSKLGANGHQGDLIIVPGGGAIDPPSEAMLREKRHMIRMKGRETYKFAVSTMADLTRDALQHCGWSMDELALLVPHQVNLRIIESASERMGLPMDRICVNIDRYGNTSAASVPVALDEAARTGRLKRGDKVILVAFGGGLTWGSAALIW